MAAIYNFGMWILALPPVCGRKGDDNVWNGAGCFRQNVREQAGILQRRAI
ncbi:hypothetical protein RUMTOR_01788 [[Ruminococcus] torques ATCC 27756]|uniref:Uncharacterized protein n=1 Tax=[Ruminococcus] torques ATCC 27756 TaxID=411460 RepID=A5KNG3_9FIRM|nr:hypothetical protein RUMTOR_01788 [[Ruminococcus] torques ATCC 27756]